MHDRRNDSRFFCADLVEVRWAISGRDQHKMANLEDISRTGMCLLMEHRILPDTDVTVRCGHEDFRGTVRYCSERETGFLLGVEFHAQTHWLLENYSPEHLLDPQDMFPTVLTERDRR